ncbi:hypothetical protein BBP40_010123 [Aspergillus hancockii]|nr:hypothetical protein BBP40_010123 [Aspergillus hancockii]
MSTTNNLKLFTDPRLPCPQRVHLVIRELNLDVSIQTVNLDQMDHKSPEYLQLNPFGAVPCLEDSSVNPPLILYESRAIARYLATKYGQSHHLIPNTSDAQALGLFEQAASIELATFDPVANRLVFEMIMKP